jgi:hypothetical protein
MGKMAKSQAVHERKQELCEKGEDSVKKWQA